MSKKLILMVLSVLLLTGCNTASKLEDLQIQEVQTEDNQTKENQSDESQIDEKEDEAATEEQSTKEQKEEQERDQTQIEEISEEILPESHMRKLNYDDLYDVMYGDDEQIIIKCIKEIYNRHNLKVNTHFKQLNEIEQYNVKLLQKMPVIRKSRGNHFDEVELTAGKYASNYQVYNLGEAINIDLDGDGVEEVVAFEGIDLEDWEPVEWTLRVNTKEQVVGGFLKNQFAIVDIDTTDPYKEIVISDYGPSSDHTSTFYRYREGKLYSIGSVDGLFDLGIGIKGNGMIWAKSRASLLHTWWLDVPYKVIDDNFVVSSDVFSGYTKVMTLVDIPMYKERDLQSEHVVIPQLTYLDLTGTDDMNWCRLETETNEVYWIYVEGSYLPDVDMESSLAIIGLEFFD